MKQPLAKLYNLSKRVISLFFIAYFLIACSPIKTPVTYQYQLSAFSCRQLTSAVSSKSILVTTPEAVGGYQTEQMLYIKKPYELSSFANNAWIDSPADMLFPLIVQSLQRSGYFKAVASSPHVDLTDYRLDTQLLQLHQNFLKNPSVLDLVVKLVLTRVSDSRVIASRIISEHITCPMNTPYGGVIAANKASQNFTAKLIDFVVHYVK